MGSIRHDLEASAEEATYLAIGLGLLGLQELRRRQREGSIPGLSSTSALGDRLGRFVGPLSSELCAALERLGRLVSDVQGRRPPH